jgi:hypothetical protein
VAATVAAVRFQSRVHRAFAAYLLLVAFQFLGNGAYHVSLYQGDLRGAAFWARMWDHAALGTVFCLPYFLVAYRVRPAPLRRTLLLLLAAAGLAVQLVYTLDPASVDAPDGQPGYLWPVYVGMVAVTGLAALVLLADRRDDACARAARLVGAVLAVQATLDGILFLVRFAFLGALRDMPPATAAGVAVIAVGIGSAAVAWSVVWRDRSLQSRVFRRNLSLAMLAAAAFAAAFGFWLARDAATAAPYGTLLFGAWRATLPLAVAYAIFRHRLFDARPAIKRGTLRTAIVAGCLAVFFVTAKLTENSLQGFGGSYILGGVLSGLALLAISPLEKLGHRVANWFVPPETIDDEPGRWRLYREFVQLAEAAGPLSAGERHHLDRLRRQLGISPAAGRALEAAARRDAPAS